MWKQHDFDCKKLRNWSFFQLFGPKIVYGFISFHDGLMDGIGNHDKTEPKTYTKYFLTCQLDYIVIDEKINTLIW